ncbi:secretogranin-1 isoform X2 [Pteronotus mesoamericanus]|uniref:secretogranin-1 isoform X2 n=1 Tax=Pteronotus mesoamericanus TaxID=1884717 RepID=UPI0023EC1F92|nr:secretogranin-1 isoform X2 [Pteronotus parnellii mesoamericanus]
MQPAVLLGFLGAAMVAAASSMPVDNRSHNDEMVTRCIIEVLSNALSKSNAPPITPECRQVLKNSGKEVKDEEKSKNENTRFEVRLLRDSADASEAHRPSSREDAGVPGEMDTQSPSVANTEGGGHSREGAGEPQRSLYSSDSQVSKEAKTLHSDKSEGEDREEEVREEEDGEKYQKREHVEGGSEEKHLEEPGETQNAFHDKRNQATAKKEEEVVSRYDTHLAKLPEEKTHSQERSSQESRDETRNQEKHLQESKRQPGSQEESEESEEDASHEVDKRRSRPRHHHGWSRPDRSSQERNPPSEAQIQPREQSEESNVGLASEGDKKDRYPTHYRASEEEPEYGEEVRSYTGVQAPESLEGGRYWGRGSEKYRAPRPPSDESQEEEDKRNHPDSELDNMARGYGEESEEERDPEWGYRHRARSGEHGAYSPADNEEKRFLGEGHYHVQGNQMDQAKRHLQEYNYDWWEKKPFEEDVNWGYEKRNLVPKLDLKRQYDRVAELDQLLHYRKKSAEYPDFYDSEEQLSPRHAVENEKDRSRPGVLTEEEEKELENLAAMDLELQKIAEKFSGN